jgi:hypothetical protein
MRCSGSGGRLTEELFMPALGKILAFGSFECTLNFRFLGILRWIDERNECLEEE